MREEQPDSTRRTIGFSNTTCSTQVRISKTIAEMRNGLVDLKKQNSDWAKHLVFLEQARNKLQRDLQAASTLATESWGEVQLRELEEFNLKRVRVEEEQRQKDFCAAYETVKNERNKIMGLIQAGSQKISQFKEKLRVLEGEVETLQLESGGKWAGGRFGYCCSTYPVLRWT